MGSDRGLPALPRGLPRDLTTYLQGLSTVVLRLSGNVRGSEQVRAVRVSEGGSSTAGGGRPSIGQNEVLSWNLANRAVTTEKMVDGCVTNPKLAPGAVTERNIATEAVVTEKLAESAVTTSKIALGAVITEKLADGSVTGEKLAKDAVAADTILDGAVCTAKLEDKSVTSNKIATKAVTKESIGDGAVTTDSIADGAVQGTKLASGVLPVFHAGTAVDGETVVLPSIWASAPVVMLTVFCLPAETAQEGGQEPTKVTVGVTKLREFTPDIGEESAPDSGGRTGIWGFTAAGNFEWVAMGYAHE